ncbi:MAG: hypothetical protein FJ030_13510 [Chloroflexi bacterium]|nr:hypothetical protein [Chloroflexota bacterium]
MIGSFPLQEGFNWMDLLLPLLGIAVVCILWIAAKLVLKLTIKVFTIGCLGILLLGLVCAAAAFFGG